jgi:acyl-CoA synthetase (AMP-forming)/AMP-acid ligase II
MPTETLRRAQAGPDHSIGGLARLIRDQSALLGDRAYLEDASGESRLSFYGLERAVQGWTARLQGAGVASDAVVALSIADPLTFASAYLSLIAAGRWVAPLDHHAAAGDAAGLLSAARRVAAEVVLTDRTVPAGLGLVVIDVGDAPPIAGPALESDCLAGGAVLASSGTTGTPKVIPLSQQQLLCTARHVAEHHHLSQDDRGFNSLPLFHINAEVVGLLATLVAGSTLIVAERFRRTDFWRAMGEREVTWINAVPAIVTLLTDLRSGEMVPPGIRFIRSASAPLPAQTLQAFEAQTGIPVLETYGMTEGASQITANPLLGVRKAGSVGLAVGVELRIVPYDTDVDGEPAVVGDTMSGQVEIRGPSVITGYGGNQHADRFDEDGWLKTGDIGHLDLDGYLYLDGRIDDVINRSGEKVFPREIEEAMLTVTGVSAAVVVGHPDAVLGQVPMAYLTVSSGLAVESVLATVKRHLEVTMVRSRRPVELRVVDAFPAGATGKVQRRRLREGDVTVRHRCDCQ